MGRLGAGRGQVGKIGDGFPRVDKGAPTPAVCLPARLYYRTSDDPVFFYLFDDGALDSLNFFADANTGSILSPVTGVQAAVNGVDTPANGAQVADGYDVGIQLGTAAGSTQGAVNQASFTLLSDNGPLEISDLDVKSFATVVNNDGGNGHVLTAAGVAGADPLRVSKEALFETSNDIHTPEQSGIVDGQTDWNVRWDKLVTNSTNEGILALNTVSTDGLATPNFNANVHNIHLFENSGSMADSLRVEVNFDGKGWVLLDEFAGNDAGTAIVGSETGQSFGTEGTTVNYSGGIFATAEDSAQFCIVSDITAATNTSRLTASATR